MPLLFILALIFAIPTFGLSLVAWFALLIFRTKDRRQYGRTQQATRDLTGGTSQMPSWSNDKDKVQEFIYVVINASISKGIPKEFAQKIFASQTSAAVALLHFAGSMEKNDASFNQQKMGAIDFLVNIWSKANAKELELFLKHPDEL